VPEGFDSRPWQRAVFLAIRAELADERHPRNCIERQLIDQLADARACISFWQERLSLYAELGVEDMREQAAAMPNRFHRMIEQTLRPLCSLRKVPLGVVVQNAGQVNVGGQQLNVAGREGGQL
jgi:hypothetical protein